jgi:DNA modification methylase
VVWDDPGKCEHEWVEEEGERDRDRSGDNNVNRLHRTRQPLNLPPSNSPRKKHENIDDNRGKQEIVKFQNWVCKKCSAWKGELGHEPTPQLFAKHLCDIFEEVNRVLKSYGTCFVNLGDSYNSSSCLVQLPEMFALEMTYERGWTLRSKIIWQKNNALPQSSKNRFTNSYEFVYFFTKNKNYYFEQQFEPYESLPHGGQFGSNKGADDESLFNVQYDPNTDPDRFYGNPGRNKRDVWSIPTQPSSVKHFATFPEKLVETPILAGCPLKICKKCGKPRQKYYVVVGDISSLDESTVRLLKSMGSDSEGNYDGNNQKDYESHNAQLPSDVKRRILESIKKEKEERWTDCDCVLKEYEPGVVLDPFVGSGTTPKVARKLGRRWIGIDISEAYLKEAETKIEGWQRPDGLDVCASLSEQGFSPPKENLESLWGEDGGDRQEHS